MPCLLPSTCLSTTTSLLAGQYSTLRPVSPTNCPGLIATTLGTPNSVLRCVGKTRPYLVIKLDLQPKNFSSEYDVYQLLIHSASHEPFKIMHVPVIFWSGRVDHDDSSLVIVAFNWDECNVVWRSWNCNIAMEYLILDHQVSKWRHAFASFTVSSTYLYSKASNHQVLSLLLQSLLALLVLIHEADPH